MNYGFVIDNSSCIGCHACSTACKSENQVPVGVNRTWVKYTEAGRFPDVRRSFQVTRCNHCSNPPCVRICPTAAMFQRDDGIVEFDSDACIGCKGCMQACPYDAIYLDPETHTAAKCHYCSHRVDVGLEPACVVVCPEHAIIAGDLDDPVSEISRVLAKHNTTVRKPEQGTAPKVFYIEGHDVALHPTARNRPESFLWADVIDDPHDVIGYVGNDDAPARETYPGDHGITRRKPEAQGNPSTGPLNVGGRMAEHMVQVVYNAQHKVQWHWPIPAYIVTKHIAAGSFLMLALAALVPGLPFPPMAMAAGGLLAILLTLVTLALLVYDLDRPDRFFYLLVRPQWRSWIARAAWILSGFSAVTTTWWAVETAAVAGFVDASLAETVRPFLAVASIPVATMASLYTAFLFAQAEGRDLWQSPHVPVQMTVHAVMFGAAPMAAWGSVLDLPEPFGWTMWVLFIASAIVSLLITLVGDLGIPHASEIARRANHDMVWGHYRTHYWAGGVLLGHLVPLALLAVGQPLASAAAFLAAAVGLFLYSIAFVMAPQAVPNS